MGDEDKLAEVVAKKHGAEKSNDTDIICKFFLEAVENNKYGWFWECPLIKKGQEEATISLEELVGTERAKLDSSKLTKITLQTFVAWKNKKLKEKAAAEKKENAKKKKEYAGGNTGGMSGRDMFMMDPNILSRHEQGDDDDDDGEDFDLTREQEEDMGVKVHEIKFDAYGIMDDGLDDSTDVQLAREAAETGGAAAVAVDEDLF